MQLIDGRLIYSATDLNDELECRYLTVQSERVARGELVRPVRDEGAELIARKGDEHEARYLEALRAGLGPERLFEAPRATNTLAGLHEAEARTREAMAAGHAIIYQATFFDGAFLGRADFLRRIEVPSKLGAWQYEVIDTKLALAAKPYYLLQLCFYSEGLARLQGVLPRYGAIVYGSGLEERFRIENAFAYYALRKRRFVARMRASGTAAEPYPHECAHCAVCDFSALCERRRDDDDHLSLVARLRRDQLAKLEGGGIATLARLAAANGTDRPPSLAPETYATLHAQAALQHAGREAIRQGVCDGSQYRHELIAIAQNERSGFELLPEPDEGDVFFDIEGDPLFEPGRSLEYLFGLYLPRENEYRPFWATQRRNERTAFEALVDFLAERHKRYPRMHVYHYAPYETAALRRLMGHYGTRENEVDRLLSAEAFVDLYAVVRQTLRISQPSYSLKALEPFYGLVRTTNVRGGADSVVMFERWLALGERSILDDIAAYNDDDCRSTYRLREWLLERRADFQAQTGGVLPWFMASAAELPPQEPDEVRERLLAGLPAPDSEAELHSCADSVRARWLLGNLLEYHRREQKPAWWQYFERRANVDQLVERDHEALGGVAYDPEVAPSKLGPKDRNWVYTYRFPEQQHKFEVGSSVICLPFEGGGEIVALDDENGVVRVKHGAQVEPERVVALVPGRPLPNPKQRAAIRSYAQAFLDGAIAPADARMDVLLARTPRLCDRPAGSRIQPSGAIDADAITTIVAALDRSYLFVQGPPGSGKSTLAAAVIEELLARDKRVAIMATTHKAIQNLLHKVEDAALARGRTFRGIYKPAPDEIDAVASSLRLVRCVASNAEFLQPHQLAAGTAWLFSDPSLLVWNGHSLGSAGERSGRYDYLFVDEAGQVALADVMACGQAAENLVLIGDPLQLAQVSQGSHPAGSGASVLEHLLGGAPTVAEDRGIFLGVSHRMHPAICGFVSQMVYDGRLKASAEAAARRIDAGAWSGAGLRYVPVGHRANRRASPEEAEQVVAIVTELLRGRLVRASGGRATDADATMCALTQDDVLVVTPYNAQRLLLQRRLAEAGFGRVRVGTVDKFQGQEAPVVIYSMATSSGDDLPRDVGFLFEKNRFNVAVSRAQCLGILVCSPELLDVRCTTVEELSLVNLLCAYVEAAAAERAPTSLR
ncbi:MAG: TM0106 family RecB-like putative nuclease [Vulcanimicrobiaceae bacterium]